MVQTYVANLRDTCQGLDISPKLSPRQSKRRARETV